MTAPYRLRDVRTDLTAAAMFSLLIVTAALLGFVLAVPHPSGSVLVDLFYSGFTSVLLLSAMHQTDRRLREVSA